MIDLAGSEDNRRTRNKGIRLKESGAINSSLFTLRKVVNALDQGLPRIPYRDSKLTRLLQDSLGGSAHSVMMANIAPEQKYYFDTLTALKFAAKSKMIINKPFSQETTQVLAHPTMKRPREDVEAAPRQPKRAKFESIVEESSPIETSLKRELNLASLDRTLVVRLRKLDQRLSSGGLKEPKLLNTPKRECLALTKKLEQSQMEIKKESEEIPER